MSEYIHFVEALARLSRRIDANAYEIAAWVYWTEQHGGLSAFINANEPYATSTFRFDDFSEVPDPLVDQLARAWFLRDDIESFDPGTRFITARELIERWSLPGGASGKSLVRSAIEGSLLLPADPYSDPFEPTLPGSEAFPVLFALDQIEQVERRWSIASTRDETPAEAIKKQALHPTRENNYLRLIGVLQKLLAPHYSKQDALIKALQKESDGIPGFSISHLKPTLKRAREEAGFQELFGPKTK